MAYESRTYRRTVEPCGLTCFEVAIKETDLQICAERDPWKIVPMAAVAIVVIIFLLSGLSRCVRGPLDDEAAWNAQAGRIELAVQPPEPYFD